MRYIRPDSASSSQLLQLQYAGALWQLQLVHCTSDERRDARAGATPHEHPLYHAVLFTSGKNQFHLDGRATPCAPGTLVLCSPGITHDFGPLAPGGIHYDEITFELVDGQRSLSISLGEVLSLFAGHSGLQLPVVTQLTPVAASRMRDGMRAVMKAATAGTELDAFCTHAALLDLFRLFLSDVATAVVPRLEPVQVAHRLILLHFAEPISIARLASESGVSAEHLCRAFRRQYGLSPMQLRQQLRLSAAARLLKTSSLSCKEVAARLGFADVQSFTKAFARHHGQTPGHFARLA